jgi:hypothetical protein
MRRDRNGRRDFANDSRRNQNEPVEGWNQIEALYARERDQRTGIRDNRHSELLDCVKLALQLVPFELEVGNALFRGVSNEVLALHPEQLRCSSA